MAEGGVSETGSPPSHTVLKLTDAEDAAAKQGLSHVGEVRFVNGALETEQTGLSHHRLRAGARQPFGHRHDRAEEVYVVIAGSGRVKLDDEIVELGELDAVRVAPGVTRAFEAGSDGLEMLAVGARHEGDGELIPGWWSD